ncbi:MAG: acyl--CoA ligase [Clostridia bacterium]|nr:acyl--CoA ligase [Clostridia bacterium]
MNYSQPAATLGRLIESSAAKYGLKAAVRFSDGGEIVSVSYEELYADARAAASRIENILPGRMNAAVIGRTDYGYITCMNGLFLSGKVFVPLSPDSEPDKLAALLDDCDAGIVFFDSKQRSKIESIRSRINKVRAFVEIGSDEFASVPFDPDFTDRADPEECAAIMYTSGTTGDFKGVMLSHRAIFSNVRFEEWDLDRSNVTLSVLPMHHIFCFACDYLKNINDGVTICLNVELGRIYRNLLLFEPTVMRLVPMIIESIANRIRVVMSKHPEYSPRKAGESVFGSRLNYILSAGAPLVGGLAPFFETMGIRVRQGYGMTEVSARVSVPDEKTDPHSGGRVISICDVRIENGEIQVKTPSIFSGYYKKPEETAAMFTPDGWFKTGDIGYITPERELFVKGRIKNLIILSGGENVSPEEIEKYYADEGLIKEMMVYEKDGAITAAVRPDYDFAEFTGIMDPEAAVFRLIEKINLEHESTREITKVVIKQTPFLRTASGKIIRSEVNET